MIESTPINEIKGIGDKTAKLFASLGIERVGDLVRYFPSSYDIYEEPVPISEVEEGTVAAITGHVAGNIRLSRGRKLAVTSLKLKDLTGTLDVVWFQLPYVKTMMSKSSAYILRGRITRRGGILTMEQPEIFESIEKYQQKCGQLWPLYKTTKGLGNNGIAKAIRTALTELNFKEDYLSSELRASYDLLTFKEAVRAIHFPGDKEDYIKARKRLVFDEFLSFIISLRALSEDKQEWQNHFFPKDTQASEKLVKSLPYSLTKAQEKVIREIMKDMNSHRPMARLVQGDVGSGKTVVALYALLACVGSGYQGAMMAPTEVLANQHAEGIKKMLLAAGLNYSVELLTGSLTAKEKRESYQRIASGEAQIIVGTHALIQNKVEYQNLALVVTDEQHRFGVKQRETFASKGDVPHILVMSATPIPRTLAIILYGDLEISVIDELPANRLPIKNCVVGTGYRPSAYKFMEEQVKAGRQCYVICPMVEESENLEAENVIDYSDSLQEHLGDAAKVAFLHGKMKQAEKEEIMDAFAKGQTDILVSTTVIEVGIDVPNATVILIENAERFGLAQLHQLRGRVGRGDYQSYCIFMTGSKAKATKERLEILNESNDGFKIANEDLRLRGPGDLFGIRQSGLMNFKLGDVFQDSMLLQQAAEAAGKVTFYPGDNGTVVRTL
ncbi:ATP-dependent DNA helicase RecG [Lachnospiraceae bacterium PFB1-21]